MHRAFTFLKNALDEVVDCAEFLYEEDSEELKPYVAEYYQQIGKMGAKVTNSKTEGEDTNE